MVVGTGLHLVYFMFSDWMLFEKVKMDKEKVTGSNAKKVPSCVLHTGPSKNEDIKCFDDSSWKKVKWIASERLKRQQTGSKYETICKILPEQYGECEGYHSSCYKKFTAFSQKEEENKC